MTLIIGSCWSICQLMIIGRKRRREEEEKRWEEKEKEEEGIPRKKNEKWQTKCHGLTRAVLVSVVQYIYIIQWMMSSNVSHVKLYWNKYN